MLTQTPTPARMPTLTLTGMRATITRRRVRHVATMPVPAHVHERRRRWQPRWLLALPAVLVLSLLLSACSMPFASDPGPTTTRTTSDDLSPGVPTQSSTEPATGSTGGSAATVDTALRDADAGWQHGSPVVGGLATASDGTILLAGSLHARVLTFATDGTAQAAYIANRDADTPWDGGSADVAAGPDGSVAFLDTDARQITIFSAPDTITLELPLADDSSPQALVIDADGRLYLAENLPDATSRITVLAADGSPQATWTEINGSAFPIAIRDLALSDAGDGLLVLTDDWQGQPAVLRLTLDGAEAAPPLLLDTPNSPGLRPTTLSAMPDGGVVVADPAWRMLVVYGNDGTLLRRIPLARDTRAEMREISVAVLPDGRVISADGQTGTLLVHPLNRVSVDGPALQTTVRHLPCDRVLRVVGVGFRPGETLVRSTIRIGETVLEGSALAPVAPDGSLALALEPDRWATPCLEQSFAPGGNPLDISALAGSVPVTTQAVLFPTTPQPLLMLVPSEEPLTCTSRIEVTGEGFTPGTEVVIEQIDPLTRQVELTVDGTVADAEGGFTAAITPARLGGCETSGSATSTTAANVTATVTLRAATVRGSGPSYPAATLTIPLGSEPTPTP